MTVFAVLYLLALIVAIGGTIGITALAIWWEQRTWKPRPPRADVAYLLSYARTQSVLDKEHDLDLHAEPVSGCRLCHPGRLGPPENETVRR